MPKLCELEGVRATAECSPWLWRDEESGRLVLRVWAEAGMTFTDVDLWDIIHWLQDGPGGKYIIGVPSL